MADAVRKARAKTPAAFFFFFMNLSGLLTSLSTNPTFGDVDAHPFSSQRQPRAGPLLYSLHLSSPWFFLI